MGRRINFRGKEMKGETMVDIMEEMVAA